MESTQHAVKISPHNSTFRQCLTPIFLSFSLRCLLQVVVLSSQLQQGKFSFFLTFCIFLVWYVAMELPEFIQLICDIDIKRLQIQIQIKLQIQIFLNQESGYMTQWNKQSPSSSSYLHICFGHRQVFSAPSSLLTFSLCVSYCLLHT